VHTKLRNRHASDYNPVAAFAFSLANMTTDQLRLFLTIVRHRSLARAAADLELGQATVSERLKALEAEVGAVFVI